ncbi:MAG TPA: peptidylprolyl isomerase [Burkholderiales bacterium]|nr:peptidylprolyl isomerase [Burkholderiales bacterium]
MLRTLIACFALLATPLAGAAGPQVEFKTNMGTIVLELYPDRAPETVKNFQQYVKSGFYKGTVFHRVIPGFMIQGGGFTADLQHKPSREPIKNEANNGLKNAVGTIAMARTSDPHSATSQFFINVVDNPPLDYREGNVGYAVFGKVTSGLDVVQRIATVPTTARPPHQNVPVKPVVIESARMLEAGASKPAKKSTP